MSNEYYQEPSRGPLDIFHFVVSCVGFFTAVGGIILSWIPVAIIGALLLAWGLAYFAVN